MSIGPQPAIRWTLRAGAIAASAAMASGSLSAQCAMCRTLLKTPEGQQLVAGLRSGILVLLAAPFLIFAAVALLAIRAQRQFDEPALQGEADRPS